MKGFKVIGRKNLGYGQIELIISTDNPKWSGHWVYDLMTKSTEDLSNEPSTQALLFYKDLHGKIDDWIENHVVTKIIIKIKNDKTGIYELLE